MYAHCPLKNNIRINAGIPVKMPIVILAIIIKRSLAPYFFRNSLAIVDSKKLGNPAKIKMKKSINQVKQRPISTKGTNIPINRLTAVGGNFFSFLLSNPFHIFMLNQRLTIFAQPPNQCLYGQFHITDYRQLPYLLLNTTKKK